jgi:arylsulfatase A
LKPGPLEIGFNHCFLLPTTNDRVPQVFVQDHRVLNLDSKDPLWVGSKLPAEDHITGLSHRETLKMNWSHGHNGTIHNGISRIGFYTGGKAARFRDEDLADAWVKQSNTWIEEHQKQPFFLFFAAHDIHVPRIPHERFQGATKMGFRGDSIVQFDWCVGELMKTVARLGLTENTLFVLCSDNGPVLDDGYQDGAVENMHPPGLSVAANTVCMRAERVRRSSRGGQGPSRLVFRSRWCAPLICPPASPRWLRCLCQRERVRTV